MADALAEGREAWVTIMTSTDMHDPGTSAACVGTGTERSGS